MEHHETAKHFIDLASIGTVVATVAGWLPAIAALLSIIWTAMRISEMLSGKTIYQIVKGK